MCSSLSQDNDIGVDRWIWHKTSRFVSILCSFLKVTTRIYKTCAFLANIYVVAHLLLLCSFYMCSWLVLVVLCSLFEKYSDNLNIPCLFSSYVLRLWAAITVSTGNFLYRAIKAAERSEINFGFLKYCYIVMMSGTAFIHLDMHTTFWFTVVSSCMHTM